MDTNRRSFFGKLLVAPLLPLVATEPEPVKTVITAHLDARLLKSETDRWGRELVEHLRDQMSRGAFD